MQQRGQQEQQQLTSQQLQEAKKHGVASFWELLSECCCPACWRHMALRITLPVHCSAHLIQSYHQGFWKRLQVQLQPADIYCSPLHAQDVTSIKFARTFDMACISYRLQCARPCRFRVRLLKSYARAPPTDAPARPLARCRRGSDALEIPGCMQLREILPPEFMRSTVAVSNGRRCDQAVRPVVPGNQIRCRGNFVAAMSVCTAVRCTWMSKYSFIDTPELVVIIFSAFGDQAREMQWVRICRFSPENKVYRMGGLYGELVETWVAASR